MIIQSLYGEQDKGMQGMTVIALSGPASACRALLVFKRLYNLWAERLHMAAWLIHLNKRARHATSLLHATITPGRCVGAKGSLKTVIVVGC